MAAPVLRWGVLGSGWIAERFIGSLQRHTRQQILAVGSRATGRAGAFAARHGIPRGYGSYAELAADADVDIVYVATPHTEHLPCARLALEAGKPVLVEKPLGLNAAQAAEIARLAAARGLRGRGPPGRRAHHVVQRHPNYRDDRRHGCRAVAGGSLLPARRAPAIRRGDRELRYGEPPVAHEALHFEAAEVARCIAAGELECPIRPLADSVTTLAALDEIRRQCGITFPGEA